MFPVGVCRDVGMSPSTLQGSNDFRIVEFSTRDEAQHAIATLSNTNFMNRQIFIREVTFPSKRTI